MDIPRARRVDGTRFTEKISHVAFDTDGLAWGLVEQLEQLEKLPGAYRVNYVRWVRFEAIPFAGADELVTAQGWSAAPGAVPRG